MSHMSHMDPKGPKNRSTPGFSSHCSWGIKPMKFLPWRIMSLSPNVNSGLSAMPICIPCINVSHSRGSRPQHPACIRWMYLSVPHSWEADQETRSEEVAMPFVWMVNQFIKWLSCRSFSFPEAPGVSCSAVNVYQRVPPFMETPVSGLNIAKAIEPAT